MHDEQPETMTVLEREIERALAVDPSPEFVARVRQRISSERVPSGWRATWIVAGAGALAAGAIVLIVVSRAPQTAPAPPTLTARSIGGSGRLQEDVRADQHVRTIAPRGRDVVTMGGHIDPHRRDHEPEVLIDAREAAALRALYEGASIGRIDLTPLAALIARVATPAEPPDLVIPPIAIEPLTPENGEGVRQ